MRRLQARPNAEATSTSEQPLNFKWPQRDAIELARFKSVISLRVVSCDRREGIGSFERIDWQLVQEGPHGPRERFGLLPEYPVAGAVDDGQPTAGYPRLQIPVILHGCQPVLGAAHRHRRHPDLGHPAHHVECVISDPVSIGH